MSNRLSEKRGDEVEQRGSKPMAKELVDTHVNTQSISLCAVWVKMITLSALYTCMTKHLLTILSSN